VADRRRDLFDGVIVVLDDGGRPLFNELMFWARLSDLRGL